MAPKILLHTCCGPCTLYPSRSLRSSGWTVYGFFYNPNIQPYTEFQKRLSALKTVAQSESLQLIIRPDYELEDFLRHTAFRESHRCIYCYSIRLETAARLAKKSKFDAFTSTLLYSKRQQHDLVRSLAEDASRKFGIPFFYQDFRKGWKDGQEAARAMGIYMQQYCGCIFSEKERFYKQRQ